MSAEQQTLSDLDEQNTEEQEDKVENNNSQSSISDEEFRKAQACLGVGPYSEEDAVSDEEWVELVQENLDMFVDMVHDKESTNMPKEDVEFFIQLSLEEAVEE